MQTDSEMKREVRERDSCKDNPAHHHAAGYKPSTAQNDRELHSFYPFLRTGNQIFSSPSTSVASERQYV